MSMLVEELARDRLRQTQRDVETYRLARRVRRQSTMREFPPFAAFLSEPLAALMVGKGRDDLVFTSHLGEVLRVSEFRVRYFRVAAVRCREADPMFPAIAPPT